MKSRRKSREVALQALYQCDTLAEWTKENIDLYFAIYQDDTNPDAQHVSADCLTFARDLIDGVLAQKESVDRELEGASEHWSLSRMSRVDRNILRIATYEMTFLKEIPVSVSINEAIEVAKRYGAPESPTFVNGVLDRIGAAVRLRRGDAILKVANE